MPSEVPFRLCYSGKKKDETGHMREQDFKSVAIAAAEQAGKIIADAYRTDFRVDYKEGTITNLVTEVDHRSEAAIAEVLTRAFPGHRILAEEGGEGLVRKSPYRWIVDPLDGTTNFAHGFPAFCVSIGLEFEGRIILGVVYDPLHRELFEAQLGGGAFLNGERIRVSTVPTLKRPLWVTGFPFVGGAVHATRFPSAHLPSPGRGWARPARPHSIPPMPRPAGVTGFWN